ncbi:3265_t:CDS:2 [Gigaspora rosea]|nr:3265_t:CDS:2 [Gigaspora rosea]
MRDNKVTTEWHIATKNRKHTKKSTQWRFDEQCLKNNRLLKEIKDEISDKEADMEWDLCNQGAFNN